MKESDNTGFLIGVILRGIMFCIVFGAGIGVLLMLFFPEMELKGVVWFGIGAVSVLISSVASYYFWKQGKS